MVDLKTITIEKEGHVGLLILNRPDSLNAFDTSMRREFVLAARLMNEDPDIRSIVLSGAGRAFCAGADLAETRDEASSGTPPRGQLTEDLLNHEYKPGIVAIYNSSKPWIAAVNGAAAGIGSSYALACDLMVMSEDAYLYQAFQAIGLIPDGGATWHLLETLGRKRAYEFIISGEKVNARKCESLGLCNRVVENDSLIKTATDWATEISQKAPLAMRYAKESLNFSVEHNLSDVISNEARLQHICIDSDDAKEGVKAFMQKRKPVFTGG